MAANLFADVLNKMEKAVLTSTKQALNRTATSVKARYAKETAARLGITSAKAKSRGFIVKSSTGTDLTLAIGVEKQLAAHDFKTAKIVVNSTRGKRIGATYTIKSQGTKIAPAGIRVLGKNSGKPIVITRYKSGNGYKVKTVTVDGFKDEVLALRPLLQQHMLNAFSKYFDSAVEFNLNKI